MSTGEHRLSRRIEAMIDDTPIVDPHTHIRCDSPGAPDLDSLMSYHWVRTELIAVGMPAGDLDPRLPPEERVRRSIPYLRRMSNTAMAWCLRRIFRDLYEFHDPHLTEQNYRDLLDRVSSAGQDSDRAAAILGTRCHIETFVTSLGNASSAPAGNPPNARFMLDAHYLFCPGVATDLEPYFVGRKTRDEYLDTLTAILGQRPRSPHQLEASVKDWLTGVYERGVRFTNTFLPIEQRFGPPDLSTVRSALSGHTLDDRDVDELVRSVTWSVLSWHHEHRKALQIAVGAEYFICDGKSIPRFQETWTSDMAKALHHFPNARFDLMMASDVLTHEVAVLARQFPNIYASGYWWHNFFPATIARIVALRMQVTPMTKFTGFLCDAYYVEWTYAKLQLVKKAMATALAGLVQDGFAEEDDLPAILHQILHDTPRDLYDLG